MATPKLKYNYGNIHEIMNVLAIIIHTSVFYEDETKPGSHNGRKVALLDSPMTGIIHLYQDGNDLFLNRLVQTKFGSFDKVSVSIFDHTKCLDLFVKATTAFRNLGKPGSRTQSVHLPQDLLNLLNYLGISPTTGKAKDKFDCRFVLKSNFDFSNMRLSPGQRWEVSNIKSPYKGKPTILNACGDNVSVRALIKGEALKDPSITGQLFKKMAYQELMAFLTKHNLTLYDYSSSKFIEEQTSKEFGKAYAQDVFESISKGGQDRLLSSLKLSNSKDFKPLHELFLKKCSSGYTPKSSEATLSNYGNFSHLTQDGLAVVKPYYDDDIGQVLINSCKIDTPSTKRHTPKKDGILVRKSENTTKQEIMVVFPFQIRKI